MNENISREAVLGVARSNISQDGENPEYDRAVVEMVCDLIGISTDFKGETALLLGVKGEALAALLTDTDPGYALRCRYVASGECYGTVLLGDDGPYCTGHRPAEPGATASTDDGYHEKAKYQAFRVGDPDPTPDLPDGDEGYCMHQTRSIGTCTWPKGHDHPQHVAGNGETVVGVSDVKEA